MIESHRKFSQQDAERYASYSMRLVLLITIGIATWQQEWLWVLGSIIGLAIDITPDLLKKDVGIGLPWVMEFLIAAVIGLNMIGVLLNAYYSIPGFSHITQFLASILFAFFAFAVIYILDKDWKGLKMDKSAMAFVVVISTMAAGVVLEFIKYFNIFGKKNYTVEEVLLSLFTTMFAGVVMALIGVNLIKKGKFDDMTDDLEKSVETQLIKRIKK